MIIFGFGSRNFATKTSIARGVIVFCFRAIATIVWVSFCLMIAVIVKIVSVAPACEASSIIFSISPTIKKSTENFYRAILYRLIRMSWISKRSPRGPGFQRRIVSLQLSNRLIQQGVILPNQKTLKMPGMLISARIRNISIRLLA